MIREIGGWKNIVWDKEAAQRVFHYCGGHPFITRHFASDACQQGSLKAIDLARAEETAGQIIKELRRHDIGNYYKEGVWPLLNNEEQEVITMIYENHEKGLSENNIPEELHEALTNLENFSLIVNHESNLRLSSHLFYVWLQRRMSV